MTFLRHFETKIDKDKPQSEWKLSDKGKQNMNRFIENNDFSNIEVIYSSPERKAYNTAEKISEEYNIELTKTKKLAEVDRKGIFIEDDEEYLDAVKSLLVEGQYKYWESKSDVEHRLYNFLNEIDQYDSVLAVSHGMIGTILFANHYEQDPYRFWKDLELGEVLEADLSELKKSFNLQE